MGLSNMSFKIDFLNAMVLIFMTIAYAYQIFFLFLGLYFKYKKVDKNIDKIKMYRYACVCSARNEEAVIGQLIRSLKNQNYPKELIDIYVIADNCTDLTAFKAKQEGAYVISRFDKNNRGKGYALDYFFYQLQKRYDCLPYEGYFVFDADNIVDVNFVKEMNKIHNLGYDAITSYRNSKNFDENWISASYSIWFLRESRFLNYPRFHCNTSCAISGTGFFVSTKLINENNGWPYHLLTEDIEFSVNCAINGNLIGYCDKAVVYDEQPVTFSQSWTQRMRWSKGFYQINTHYTIELIKGIFVNKKHRFSSYDLLMTTAPSMILTLSVIGFNLFLLIDCILNPSRLSYVNTETLSVTSNYIFFALINFYLIMYFCGVVTILSEWKKIRTTSFKKIIYSFMFPIFMMTYIPIALVALFKKVEWKPIKHFATDNSNHF